MFNFTITLKALTKRFDFSFDFSFDKKSSGKSSHLVTLSSQSNESKRSSFSVGGNIFVMIKYFLADTRYGNMSKATETKFQVDECESCKIF